MGASGAGVDSAVIGWLWPAERIDWTTLRVAASLAMTSGSS